MIGSNVARRYAKAILELGAESGRLETLVNEMSDAAAAYQSSPELRAALENPLVALDAKKAILDEMSQRLGLSPTAHHALRLLGDRRRLRVLPSIAQLLREMHDAKRGVVRAEVITAVRLSDGYYQRLQTELEKMTGKKVVLETREDESIIAGVITRIGDMVVDGSLRARLQEMKTALLADPTA
ncbi:MAG: synthase delta chain [Myxococcaceae bacterium]|nr:synthase delta chain [Myxococcaceae bacterium]